MSKIIDFYNGKIPLHGRTFNDVCMFNNKQLDICHDFIQWLFPTVKVSAHHPNAPTLTQEDIETFNNNSILKKKLLYAFDTYLLFLGLVSTIDTDGITWIEKGDNYPDRKLCWQTPFNHNYLRITRVLDCLITCGLEREAKAFFNCLEGLTYQSCGSISFESYSYWHNVMCPTEDSWFSRHNALRDIILTF